MSKNTEFDRFDETMRQLMQVPRSTIKAKLDAEKRAKTKKRKPKRASASRDSGASRHGNGGN